MEIIGNEDDEGGAPAQTGSLTHEGVAAFHKTKGTLEIRKTAAWQAIANAAGKFPLAEENEVRLFITPYMADPRNQKAELLEVEHKIEFELDPSPIDPTGERIYVEGTLDQIRLTNGIPKVWDLKTGKRTGWEMLHDYAIQLAGYVTGATRLYPNVEPGGIIRNYGYRVRGATTDTLSPDGVFFAAPFTKVDIPNILEEVQLKVALIRMGIYTFGTGIHCTYCEFGGLLGCQDNYKKLVQLGKL